ncbi:MAG: hypothetical protein ACYCV4_05470 [Dermatophilaceae bacterium]
MGKVIGVISLVIGGIIVADLVIHPQGTTSLAKGATTVATPTYNALLGK